MAAAAYLPTLVQAFDVTVRVFLSAAKTSELSLRRCFHTQFITLLQLSLARPPKTSQPTLLKRENITTSFTGVFQAWTTADSSHANLQGHSIPNTINT
eukprot:1152755-Pelagomonas_calceolata.AAC.1